MKRWQLFLPLIIFLSVCLLLYAGIFDNKTDALPSPLLNKPLPDFLLNTVLDKALSITPKDMLSEVALINVWATWCIACRIEHPYLNKLKKQGIPLYGINYKDNQNDAKKWLTQLHNPYRFSINDSQGTLGIDLGVYGAPETYIIDKKGIIRYKHVGIIDDNIWKNTLKPYYDLLIKQAKDAL